MPSPKPERKLNRDKCDVGLFGVKMSWIEVEIIAVDGTRSNKVQEVLELLVRAAVPVV